MPWRKVDTLALSLLRKILDPNPTNRIVLDAIVDHKWCNMLFENTGMHNFEFNLLNIVNFHPYPQLLSIKYKDSSFTS